MVSVMNQAFDRLAVLNGPFQRIIDELLIVAVGHCPTITLREYKPNNTDKYNQSERVAINVTSPTQTFDWVIAACSLFRANELHL